MLSEKAQKNLENLDNYIGTYTTFEEFEECNSTYEPKAEDVVYCTEENKLYIYDIVEGWHTILIPENGQINTGISVYDLNKQAIEQLGPAKEGDIRHARGLINKINKTSHIEYYMLLFKEISYYTVFHNVKENPNYNYDYEKLGTAVMDCINDIGTIY